MLMASKSTRKLRLKLKEILKSHTSMGLARRGFRYLRKKCTAIALISRNRKPIKYHNII
jgi:hypothetical protein